MNNEVMRKFVTLALYMSSRGIISRKKMAASKPPPSKRPAGGPLGSLTPGSFKNNDNYTGMTTKNQKD